MSPDGLPRPRTIAEQLQDLARQLARETPPEEDAALSDIEIDEVVSGARRKGIAMRQIRRVDGPYPNGPKWRLRIVLLNGSRSYHPQQYDTKEQAERAKKALEMGARRESGPTTRQVIEEYQTFLVDEAENVPASVQTTITRLRGFFAPALDTPLSSINALRAGELKEIHDSRQSRQAPPGTPIARETRRAALAETKTFIRWAAELGYADPKAFDALKLDTRRGRKARRSRGKPTLRDHERVRWWAKALVPRHGEDDG